MAKPATVIMVLALAMAARWRAAGVPEPERARLPWVNADAWLSVTDGASMEA